MHKILPALAAVSLVAAPLHAQAGLGVFGGFVSSSVTASSGTFSVTPSSRPGFAVGLSLAGQIGPHVAIAPEAMYIQKGYKLSGNGETFSVHGAYMEVPVLLRATFGRGPTRFFLTAGPTIAFRLSCSETDTESGTGSASVSCESLDINVKSTDFSAMFGGGIDFNQFSLQARYDLGLVNVDKDATGSESIKNHAILLFAAYRFGK